MEGQWHAPPPGPSGSEIDRDCRWQSIGRVNSLNLQGNSEQTRFNWQKNALVTRPTSAAGHVISNGNDGVLDININSISWWAGTKMLQFSTNPLPE
jgi:hypothetical protein